MTKSLDDLLRDALHERTAKPSSDCLDAGIFAAWFDDSLADRDRTAVEAHVADCARCQALLATMARTAPPPVAHGRRYSFIGWLVPITVAAAGVLVWVNLPERAVSPPAATAPTAVAANHSTQNQTVTSAPLEPAAPAPADRRERTGPTISAARNEAVAKREDQRADTATRDRIEPAKPAPSAPQQAPASAPTADKDSAAPAPAASAAVAGAISPPPPATLAETVTVSGAAPARALLRGAPRQVVIESTDGSTRWRIAPRGPGGDVERSTDGGRTWQTQATGATAVLTAGASPSPSVCWLVGPRGTLLITTDGRRWQRLDFPEAVDLVSIRATDDKTATVTAADGRVFTTTNRGRTWER